MARAAVRSARRYLRASPRLAVVLILVALVLLSVLSFCYSDRNNHLLLFDSSVSAYEQEPISVAFARGGELTLARGRVGGGNFFSDDTRRSRELTEEGPQPLVTAWGPRSPRCYGVCVPWLVVADSQILIRHVPTSSRLATEDERSWVRTRHVEAVRNWQHRSKWMTDRVLEAAATGGGKITIVRPFLLIADLFTIALIGAAVSAAICLGQWWWRREWSLEDGKGTVRHHAMWLWMLAALLMIDLFVVTVSIRSISPPFCSHTTTLLGSIHRGQTWPAVEVVFDGAQARLVFDILRSEWPATWETVTGKLNLPSTVNTGLITPYRTIWWHGWGLLLLDERGGEDVEKALRKDLVGTFRADPEIGPRMPTWYWDKLADGDWRTETYNYWLLLHDSLFAGVLTAIGWCVLTFAVAGAKWLRGPRPGFCAKCRYDLSGLRADRCPECGTAIREGDEDSAT